jgi:hypothetical protein
MGQLIKLQDYVSRYEQNIYEYPTRYVRLKKQQWEKIYSLWESNSIIESIQPVSTNWLEEEKQPLVDRMKGFFKKERKDEEALEKEIQSEVQESSGLSFFPSFTFKPATEVELKHQFLDQLFRFQMKWGSTTLLEQSNVNKKYLYDHRLKYFLQRFPDTTLVMYEPIFLLKKAPVEVETILITPTDVWCISFLEEEDHAVFQGTKERFWVKRHQEQEQKVLNPLIGLNRTEKIVKKIFELYEIELPIHKVVLSRNGYIDYPFPPYGVQLIEKRNYEEWFQTMRSNRTPLKHAQLKAAQMLLHFSQTTSMRRIEWDVLNKGEQEEKEF